MKTRASSVVPRAAQYVRMSTEHQQYSTKNQAAAIGRYAAAHGMQIVRSFVDAGKSGLRLAGRNALQELMQAVETGQRNFDHILVYDVSRWGRFQDNDESAFYEFICKRSGIKVHYCAEPFANDGSVPSNLLKAIKRTMAGEYSRALSAHVFAAQCRLAKLGFRQGGQPGYGLRRQLVDREGRPKLILVPGDRKNIQTDRIILVPGPAEEVATVRRIFRLFATGKWKASDVARLLDQEGIKRQNGRRWRSNDVIGLLSHPKYMGANVYNRRSFKLREELVKNPSERWILKNQAFQPIVSQEQFLRVQEIIAERRRHQTDEEMLEGLKRLLAQAGQLTGPLIDQAEGLLTSAGYRRRFGSLGRAWSLAGYAPGRDFSYVDANRHIEELYREELDEIIARLRSVGAEVEHHPPNRLLLINREFTARFVLARCVKRYGFRWLFPFPHSPVPDVMIFGRMGSTNQAVLDYYLFSSLDLLESNTKFTSDNAIDLESHRFTDLSTLMKIASRTGLVEAS